MSLQTSTKIQILWQKFLQSDCDLYEKSSWFDAFLCEFLLNFKDGNQAQDIMPFTSLSGVATLISCELLSDVHQICSQPGDGEDLAPLRRHLLRGRGWRTLAVLHCLGIKDVSCASELARLLVSLYPVCLQTGQSQPHLTRKSGVTALQITAAPQNLAPPTAVRNPYVLLNCSWEVCSPPGGGAHGAQRYGHRSSYQLPGVTRLSPGGAPHFRKYSNPPSRSTSGTHNSGSGGTSHQSRVDLLKKQNNAAARQRKRSRSTMEPDSPKRHVIVTSESEAPHDAKLLINKSNTLKIRLNPMDFDYFDSVVRSEDERDQDLRWKDTGRRGSRKLTVEDLTDDGMREVRAQTVTPAELSQLIIHLVQDLCRSESPVSTHQICLEAVNFALENLCSLQFGSAADALSVPEVVTTTSKRKSEDVSPVDWDSNMPEIAVEARTVMDSIRVVARSMSSDLGIKCLNPYLRRLEDRLFETYFPDANFVSGDVNQYRTGSPDLVDFARSSAPMVLDDSLPKYMWKDMESATGERKMSDVPVDKTSSGQEETNRSDSPAVARTPTGEVARSSEDVSEDCGAQVPTVEDRQISYDRFSVSGESELQDILEDEESFDGRRRTTLMADDLSGDDAYDDRILKERLGLPDVLTVSRIFSRYLRYGGEVVVASRLYSLLWKGCLTFLKVADLKLTVSHLLLTALERVLHPEVIGALINAGVLPIMLRVLEDAIRKTEVIAKAARTSVLTDEQERTAEGLQELVMGVLYGVAAFLHCLLLHRTSVEKIHEFEEQFRFFGSSNGSRLIEKTVSALLNCNPAQKEASYSKAKKVVTLVGQLIISLKQARSTLVHSLQCRKTRHKLCKGNDTRRHHHHYNNLFGHPVANISTSAVGASVVPQGGPCNVSYLFASLVRILAAHIQSPELALPLMRVMSDCGTCCCFPAKTLLNCLTKLLHSGNSKVRALGFDLLERTVFMELGATEANRGISNREHFRCSVCNQNVDSAATRSSVPENDLLDPNYKIDNVLKEDRFSDSCSSDHSDSLVIQDGNCLDFYRDLLCSNVPKLCHTAATHLLKLTPRCNERVQLALMTNVFFPSFIHAKERYLSEKSDMQKFILLSCLSAFSCLICTPSLAEHFLQLGGMKHILELMDLSPFVKLACSVLEVIITVDVEWKAGVKEMNIDVAREEDNNDLLNISSLKYLVESIENRSNELLDKLNGPDNEGSRRERLRPLHNVGALWRCAMNLSLCNPQLREFFAIQPVIGLGFRLLQAIFRRVVSFASLQGSNAGSNVLKEVELKCYLYMRLMEAILVLHFTSSPFSTRGILPSNEVLISDLRRSLCHREMTVLRQSVTGIKTMRWLCDLLIHCSVAEPCKEEIIPALRKKTPAFMIASVWDSEQLEDDKEEEEREKNVEETDCDRDDSADKETFSDGNSSVEEPYVTADEGYEADVEVLDTGRGLSVPSDSESTSTIGGQTKLSGKDETSHNTKPSRPPSPHNIVYPELCLLAVDLLVYINNYEDADLEQSSESEGDEIGITTGREATTAGLSNGGEGVWPGTEIENPVVRCLLLSDQIEIIQRLISLCRDNPKNCTALSNCKLMSSLMTGFSQALSTRDEVASPLQIVILELITLLAQHSISASDLSKYLSFFKSENPPLEALLQPLVALVTSARPQPNYILCFPVADILEVNASIELASSIGVPEPPPKITNLFGRGSNSSSSQRKTNGNDPSDNTASSLAHTFRKQHISEGLKSCWSRCAIALPVDSTLGWAMWAQGFSLSMWFRLERPPTEPAEADEDLGDKSRSKNNLCMSDSLSDSWSEWGIISSGNSWLNDDDKNKSKQHGNEKFLHLVSVGTDNLVLELWCNVATDSFHLRLTRSDSRTSLLVAEAIFDSCLASGQWHHLAMNVKDLVKSKKTCVEVTTIVDGCYEKKSSLGLGSPLPRKPRPTCVLIGHTLPAQTVVQGSWSLSSLQLFRQVVFTRERAVYIVGLGPSHTNLTECRIGREKPNFTTMFGSRTLLSGISWDSILDTGNANLREPQDSILLSYSAQNPNVVNVYPHVVNSSLFSGQSGFRVVTPEHRASQQLPLTLQPVLMVPLVTQQYHGLVAAASVLGGASVFLFLFARVVELNGTEVEQARALFLLLKLVQSDTQLFSQFVQNEYHKLLLKVLSSPRCTPGHHVLKAVLDACCDKPVLQHQPGPMCQFRIVHQSEAIVVNSFLLSTIVASWRDWGRAGTTAEDGGVLGTLFRALHVLLRDDHAYREFNAAQLNRVRLVEALLLFCKERFLYEEGCPLHPSVCTSLVELVRSLMGAPPEFAHVVAVADCLLLLHPANATYITHMRPSYYFLLSPSPPEPSPPVYSRKGHPAHYMYGDLEPLKKKSGKRKSSSRVSDRRKQTDKNMHPSKMNSTKLDKSLTNLRIKQNREDTMNLSSDEESGIPITGTSNEDHSCSESTGTMDTGNSSSVGDSLPDRPSIGDNDTGLDSGDESKDEAKKEVVEEKSASRDSSEKGTPVPTSMAAEQDSREASEHKEFVPHLTEENSPNFTDMKEKQQVWDWSQAVCGESARATAESEDQPKVVDTSDDDVGSMHSLVVEGLLLLLRDTLRILPDNMASQVLTHVVQAEMILVMMNNSNARVRAALVKVLAAYLHRATDEEINKFLKMKGFYLLASQLGLYPATKELVEATASLVMQRADITLEELTASLAEQVDEKPVEFSPVQLAALPALLALLPRMNHDLSLSHSTMALFREIMQQSVNALKALLDAGVIEVLLKMLVFLAHQRQDISDSTLSSEQDTLISEIHLFLLTIVGLVLNTSGGQLIEVLKDIQFQLVFLHQAEVSSCGAEARCVKVLRCTQCTLLEGSLDIVVGKLSSDNAESIINPHGNDVFNPWVWNPLTSSASNSSASTVGSITPLLRPPSKRIPRFELFDRFKTVLSKAVEFFIYSEPMEGIASETNSQEQNFVRRLLTLLIQGNGCLLDRRGSFVNNSLWNSAMWAARNNLRSQIAQLLVWLLSPRQTVTLRMFTIEAIQNEHFSEELLTYILRNFPKVEHKFMIGLWSLLYGRDGRQLEDSEVECAVQLSEKLQRWGLVSPHLLGNPHDSWMGEIALMLREMAQKRANYTADNRAAIDKSVFKMEGLYRQLVDAAMNATRNVVELQNSERKTFMEHIKNAFSENVHLRIKWQQLIQVLTHERAVWFFKESYPTSWQLDATEGPARVRKRLQRCHLHIKSKFFSKSHRNKLLNGERPGPLSFLFEKDTQSTEAPSKETPVLPAPANSSSVLIDRLHTNEQIQHMSTARVVTPSCEILGELLIGESCLYFVADTSQNDIEEVTSGGVDMCSCAWQFDDVKEILNRRFLLKERAIEIFLVSGRTHLIAFQSTEERDLFLEELSQCELQNRISGDRLSEIIEQWRDGVITNWEYLMQLNKLAGRSYNDLMQYLVMPFVLSDYVSTVLDLTDPSSFRVFSRPMAIQNPANEQYYINYYNDLKQGWLDGMNPCQKPHHYTSHYSNPGTVLHFLLRLPPYTRMFLQYQDNKFDLADRTFHSLHTTWRLTSSESSSDVKELIPEFFFLPEFLVNNEGFDFGIRQNGERVDTVELPPWSNGNARTFVLVHRQALESDYVRENLMHWIDLVFGYKQSGKAAFDAINLFHPATYSGFDITTIENPQGRSAWETMIRLYGQTPRQLFKSPHPMVVQSLVTKASNQSVRPVINSVKGLVWGSYVGSPAEPEPSIAWKHAHRNLVAKLVSLQTNDVFGLATNTTILLNHCSDKNGHTPTVQGVGLVTWGHADSVVRVKLKKEHPPWPIIRSPDLDPITLCASTPDCAQLWVGYSSGRITVHRYTFEAARQQLDFSNEPVNLFGHSGPILDLSLCRSFSIAVSASQDGSAIIWDLNNLLYVRTIWHKSVSVERPVTLCGVSETLGDIVTVCHERKSMRRANAEKNSYCPWDSPPLSGSANPRSSPTPLTDDWEIVADVQPENRKPIRSSSWSALRGLPKWQSRQRASSQGSSKDEKPSPTSSCGSVLYLHSVNASLVGKILTKPRITAVCFSTAPEGISVNVIATGLESGVIRLWSTWDLTPVRDIAFPALSHPIVSLAYSRDCHHLYASTTENVVVILESGGSKNTNKLPKFHDVSYLEFKNVG